MPEQKYRWLLFDADNTLFDFDAAEEFAVTQTLLAYGLPADAETKGRYRAINVVLWAAFDRGEISQEELVVERFARFLKEMERAGDPAEWNDFYLHRLAEGSALLPGAEELCRKLASRYVLALATNGVPFVQHARLAAAPIGALFDGRVYISGELGCRKPERAFFDRALEDLGAAGAREGALVIGDSLSSDIQGARNAGLDSVWFNRKGARRAENIRPTYEAVSFDEIARLLGV